MRCLHALALTVAKTSYHYDCAAIFTPVRPRVSICEHKRPQGASGHKRNWGHIRGTLYIFHHFTVGYDTEAGIL